MKYSGFEFDFERLEVYKKSIKLADFAFTLAKTFPKELQYSLGDQFRRAALSICNNLAEGSRKRGKSKEQFYGYALDSARECIPIITIIKKQKLIFDVQYKELRDEIVYISNMIRRLIKNSQ